MPIKKKSAKLRRVSAIATPARISFTNLPTPLAESAIMVLCLAYRSRWLKYKFTLERRTFQIVNIDKQGVTIASGDIVAVSSWQHTARLCATGTALLREQKIYSCAEAFAFWLCNFAENNKI